MNNPNESNPPADHEHRAGGVSAETRLLSDFLHLISGSGVRMVFWVCPKGCRGAVVWTDDKTDATCQVCGVRKSDNGQSAPTRRQ